MTAERAGCAVGRRFSLRHDRSEKLFTREARAYGGVDLTLGHSRAPHLIVRGAGYLALLLTAVPGSPAVRAVMGPAEWRAVHRQAGSLCARLHEAGALDHADRAEAEAALDAAADGAEKYLDRTADRPTENEQQVFRGYAAQLRRIGPLPVGYIHGDSQPRNWLIFPAGLALVDFERTRPAARIPDLVILAVTEWLDHLGREKAFFQVYGRALTGAEWHGLRCLTALDAVNCPGRGPDNDDAEVTARGRRTLDRLMRQNRP
ncbi:phosphotransferase [Streptomyces sp. NRRL S-118]|uniref:phosphotransferase n=1 Tax=Streptomyces sp. NRRL S-118 TaxID=1463881 RepID=UPI002D21B25E|nr:phosphotransferase [Streptomyces sp. NRRL S-118]